MIAVVFDSRQYVILELSQISKVGSTGHCGLRHCVCVVDELENALDERAGGLVRELIH